MKLGTFEVILIFIHHMNRPVGFKFNKVIFRNSGTNVDILSVGCFLITSNLLKILRYAE